MRPDKISKHKPSFSESASFQSSGMKSLGGSDAIVHSQKRKKSNGKSSVDSKKVPAGKKDTEQTSKHKNKDAFDDKPSESGDNGVCLEGAEIEIAGGRKESSDVVKKVLEKSKKRASGSKEFNDAGASAKEISKNNSLSSDDRIKMTKRDVLLDKDSGDKSCVVPTDENKGDKCDEVASKSVSESELSLETTEDGSSQEEQEAEEGESTVSNDEEGSAEEGSAEEVSAEEGSAEEGSAEESDAEEDGDAEQLTVADLVDEEAEEGSETDESVTQSEITLSSSDEERKNVMFEGGSKLAPESATKKSDRRYDEESDDMDGFIVDDDFIEPMSYDEAADLPDVLADDERKSKKKHRRIVNLPDSSNSEDSEIDFGLLRPRNKKFSKSNKRSQLSVEATEVGNEPEVASERKQIYRPASERSSAKSKAKKYAAKVQECPSSEQEASVSKVPPVSRSPGGRARQVLDRSHVSKMSLGNRPLRSPRLAIPIRPRLSRLDEFRISKGLSPVRSRRESRDGSENWSVSDVQHTSKTSNEPSANVQPGKKYAKLTTLYKKKKSDDACRRVALKRSRCESESPLPRKKFKH